MGDTRRSEAAADFSRFETNKKESSTDSDGQSTRTLPTITKTNTKAQQDRSVSPTRPQEIVSTGDGSADVNTERGPEGSMNAAGGLCTSIENAPRVPTSPTGWLSWLGRPTSQQLSGSAKKDTEDNQVIPVETDSSQPEAVRAELSPETSPSTRQTSSWFGSWSSPADHTTHTTGKQGLRNEDTLAEESKIQENGDVVMQDAPIIPVPAPVTAQPSAGSTWAFWSRESVPRKSGGDALSSEQGELAVMGDGSETSPRKSSVEVNDETSNKKELLPKPPRERPPKSTKTTKGKRNRSQPMDIEEPVSSRPGTPNSDVTSKKLSLKPGTALTPKIQPPNLLLPSFKSTYRMKENPSIIKQITQLLLRTQQSPTKHVFLSKETPTIKKALAIGVHGLFPASYLRPMIGQPTGTSIKFANHCAEAIRRWTKSNGSDDCEIEKVALEGEGKIADRVDNLWKLLLNWTEHIKNADLVMLACHSQGVPVSIMLLARLVELGVITNSRIGVCAMAGVSLGPFPDYKSGMGMLMGSAAELWQFADPKSEISKRYEQALKTVVDYGARITVS